MQESQYFHIKLRQPLPHAIVLQGLEQWFNLGLIANLSWRSLPQEHPDRQIELTIYKDENKNDALYKGISAWAELGLLDDRQIQNICRNHLSSQLSENLPVVSVKSEVETNKQVTSPATNKLSAVSKPRSELLSELKSPAPSSEPTQMLQALFSEFSTLWLLFLGVFLTIVSSGLLAASQWQNFSNVGQYSILFAYTLGFLAVSFITIKSSRLRLTTRTLQLVTLLLVPANFWAIDGLGLLDSAMGITLGAIAGLILSGITIYLLYAFKESNRQGLDLLTAIAILLLAWTHLGWGFRGYPLVAVYIGIGGMAASTFFNRYRKLKQSYGSDFPITRIVGVYGTMLLVGRALLFGNVSISSLGLAIAICGWVLCQINYLSNRELSDTQLKSNENNENSEKNLDENSSGFEALLFQTRSGQVLLALGWFTAIWDTVPWQAIAVSLLIAWLIGDRLHQNKSPNELTKLFFWGLQILWLCVRLIPNEWWGGATGWAKITAFFQTDSFPAIIGVVSFPYLLLALGFAAIYRRHQQYALALRSEYLALGFGVFISILSFAYPFTRFINLSLSALCLASVLVRRSPNNNQFLIYTTHLVSLGAIASGIDFNFPSLTLGDWSIICVIIALAEWSATWGLDVASTKTSDETDGNKSGGSTKKQIWRNSAWQYGLVLSGLSYFLAIAALPTRSLFLITQMLDWIITESTTESYVIGLIWAIVPLTLGFLGTRRSFKSQAKAIEFSIVGIYVGQLLTWADGTRLIGLGLAVLVMLVNTRRFSNLFTTLTTTGFGLLFIGSSLWQIKENSGAIAQLTFSINGMVLCIILLFMLGHWLKWRRTSIQVPTRRQIPNLNLPLNIAYARAFDLWAVFLAAFFLLLQTYLTFSVFSNFSGFSIFSNSSDIFDISGFFNIRMLAFGNGDITRELFVNLFWSSVLVTAGLVYRAWQNSSDNSGENSVVWTEWGITWGIELIVAGAIALNNSGYSGSVIQLAIANLGLGLISQLLGDWWQSKNRITRQNSYQLWNVIPLVYVAIAIILRMGTFNNSSGLFTLGAALVGIGIGRRGDSPNKLITYISLVGITIGAYELLWYQMIATGGDSVGDGMVILGILGCAIAYIYQVFSKWILSYLKSVEGIDTFAHLHWFMSALFLIIGSSLTPSSTGGTIGVGLAIALTIYALIRGRSDISEQVGEFWIYEGIALGIVGTVYQFAFASPNPRLNQILIAYSPAIASGVSTIFLLIPWRDLGWSPRPWHRAALGLPLLFVSFFTAFNGAFDTGFNSVAIATPSLLIIAIFYAVRSLITRRIRLTYFSGCFLAWICFRFIADYTYVQLFTSACTVCALVIYFSHVEPSLKYSGQDRSSRDPNHIIRSFAVGSLCLIAFVYALSDIQMALITWGLSTILAIAGLMVRIRAYLFIGTITFIALVLNQAVLLVAQYGFLLWAIGIVAGISFITLAANFEVRRERILAIARYIFHELDAWA